MWVGAGLAIFGLLSLMPYVGKGKKNHTIPLESQRRSNYNKVKEGQERSKIF
ncbi:hypothetical protein EMIT07CA2_50321 [Brevibacillus sp. IT-7CA2]